jgi:hypothetical protein
MSFFKLFGFGERKSTHDDFSSSEEIEREALKLLKASKRSQIIDLCENWYKSNPNNFMITKALGSAYYDRGKVADETKLFSHFMSQCDNIHLDGSNEISILRIDQLKNNPIAMNGGNWVTFQQYGELIGTPEEVTGLFVFIKIDSKLFNFRAYKGCQLLLDYIATIDYPLLWFRAQLDDGSRGKAVVEHFVDIADKQRIGYLINFLKNKNAIISIYDESGNLRHITGLILEHPSQTTRYLAQIYACEKDYVTKFSNANAADFMKAQKSMADLYPITIEW